MEARPQRTIPEALSASLFEGPLKLLVETGLLLARERSVDTIVQAALDAGRELCNAEWGAFFYSEFAADGAPCPLYKLSGQTAEQHARFLLPTANSMLVETFFGGGTVRCADISDDAHFGPDTPFGPLTSGPNPVRSYMAVPVHSASGELLGGMIYGHSSPHIFTEKCEPLIETLAAQAAVAVDNTRLHEHLSYKAIEAGAARQLQRETADRLQQVFEATTDAVHLCDRHWRITYMNSRARNIVAGGKDLTGQAIWEAFPEAVGSVFYNQYAEVMNGAGPREFTEFYPPLGLWLAIKVFPTAEGIAVFFQDITEDRRLAREKAEADRRLRQALDAAQLGTWTWNRATDMLDLDERAAALYLVKPHLPISRTELRNRIVVEDDRPLTLTTLQHAVETGSLYHAEYRVISQQGTHCWISARGMPTFAPDSDEVIGMIGTVQDITLRKTQEGALRQSEKLAATGRLAATIAHEINNPLEAVTNLIYLVKTDPAVPPAAQHLLETADQELARVAQIAQQTLGFYRDTTRPAEVDISELLTGVINLFHRKLTYKRIDYTLDLEPGLHVFGLQGELRQVFSNLIVNSIDASHNCRITIRSRSRSVNGIPGVSVLICDEGSGVPAAVRDRLFSPFFTTKLSVGTGLGLWVTRGIVEKQGGSIRFRSRDVPPTGTTFRVFLRATGENLFSDLPDPAILQ